MPNSLTPAHLVRVLRKVPEKRFSIMDLAPQLVDEKGRVDVPKCIDRQGELNLAIVEVESYVRATKDICRVLKFIEGGAVEVEGYEEEDLDVEDIE